MLSQTLNNKKTSPMIILFILGFTLLIAHTFVMLINLGNNPFHDIVGTFIDSVLLLIITFPVMYLFVFPLHSVL